MHVKYACDLIESPEGHITFAAKVANHYRVMCIPREQVGRNIQIGPDDGMQIPNGAELLQPEEDRGAAFGISHWSTGTRWFSHNYVEIPIDSDTST